MADYDTVDALVRDVAALLPFQIELVADMAGPSMLQIELGRRGGDDDPSDTASIDITSNPVVWMFDVEGGRETIASSLGLEADPHEVAGWIAAEAELWGSPVTKLGP